MSTTPTHPQPQRGQLGYLQLPAHDVARSLAFYTEVFGWTGETEHGSFEAPGLIGQWSTDLEPAGTAGPVLWLCADQLWVTLDRVVGAGGAVRGRPVLDQGERWLVEVDDPAGNRLGIVVPARTASPQTLLAVADVEAASRWYRELLGLTSDHGGPHYERLLADGTLVLQLHARDVAHDHGTIGTGTGTGPAGDGVLVWFGEVSDFDGVLRRAEELGAETVRPVHPNPPEEEGGGGPAHREVWLRDLDGYTVVVASPDGELFDPAPAAPGAAS